jgi:hypothetical protein
MTTKIVAGLIGAFMALGATIPANANGVPHFDSNLERWAKQRIAAKMGELRGAYKPGVMPVLVSEATVRRGLVPLNQLPTDAERGAFEAFGISADSGFNFPARLAIEQKPDQTLVAAIAELRAYQGAFVTAGESQIVSSLVKY